MIILQYKSRQIMINLKTTISFFILLIFSQSLVGQNSTESTISDNIFYKIQEKEEGQGDVLIFQDIRINDLIYNHIEQNKRRDGIPGFRIRIFSDLGSSAREESQAVRTKFYELFPEIPIYLEYRSPYFRVYVGDFRTNIDALKEFKRIQRYFPSAFIKPDQINFPKLDE